jgi:hypothetical protein
MKKEGKMKKGSMAASQIIILVVSLIAFSYFVGSEFKVVSADECLVTKSGQKVYDGSGHVKVGQWSQSQINSYCENNEENCNGVSGNWGLNQGSCFVSSPTNPQPPAVNIPATVSRISEAAIAARIAAVTKKAGETGEVAAVVAKKSIGSKISGFFKGNLGHMALAVAAAAITYFGMQWAIKQWFGTPSGDSGTTVGMIAGFTVAGCVVGGPIGCAVGLGIGIVVTLWSGDTSTQGQVSFSCNPWEAPVGGKDCEQCNKGDFPCTEYKCRSLGQQCELLNKGTTEELCTYINRLDVNPPVITPWVETLTTGYNYNPESVVSPADRAVKIIPGRNVTGCIEPWTPIRFGITLNQPAKCKISTLNVNNYSSMSSFFGGSSTSKYNHSQTISGIPSSDSLEAINATLQNGGQFVYYVRCQNAAGRANVGNFIFKFCVDKGPDRTQPKIVETSIRNGLPISFGQSSVALKVYVNKPAECKWSHLDRSYDDMESDMSCALTASNFSAQMLYSCSTTLTGLVDRVDNNFYFRCKDQPHLKDTNRSFERNVNTQSYKFMLKGTQPLVIDSASPNGTTMKDSTNVIKVTLAAKTSAGFNAGEARCSYKDATTTTTDFVEFLSTGTFEHSQELWLPAANYSFVIRCIDGGGNADNKTISFRIETDTIAPIVGRVFRQENKLKVITNEEAQCVYGNVGCDYELADGTNMSKAVNGTEHSTAWDTNKVFYIKCSDKYGNRPLPNQCNIIARPFEIPTLK